MLPPIHPDKTTQGQGAHIGAARCHPLIELLVKGGRFVRKTFPLFEDEMERIVAN